MPCHSQAEACATMDDPRSKHLEKELDYAINQARLLRARLRAQAAPPDHAAQEQSGKRRQRLHAVLDGIQRLTPEFLRRLVRPIYLNCFYYPAYPEHSPRAIHGAPAAPRDPLTAHSGFPPFLEFKHQLCRELSMDFHGISVACQPDLVSVVLPVFNGARFVKEAINSVLEQTHDSFELIIVDDGSTDETPKILGHFADHPKIRVLRQANRGLPTALNRGFADARGEFFTWISDDNRMHPGMLSELAGFLNSNPDIEMVYADEELIDERGAPVLGSDFCSGYQSPAGSNTLRWPRDPGELNFIQNNFIGGCFLYRAWAARIVGDYSESCFGFEDYDYWIRMNALFRIAHLAKPDILYSYRLQPASLTAREKELRIAERAKYFMSVECERRRFFVDAFDILLVGRHPSLAALARAYRRSGHNVMESAGPALRAFPKSITIAGDGWQGEQFALLRGDRVTLPGLELAASSVRDLEYPLLAAANSWLWRRKECPVVP
jgi:glycosyltransferase involved in cell wall biosynthesis